MLVRYLKGAGASLFIGMLLFFLTVPFHRDYIKTQLLFVALYNYFCCLLGAVLFFVLTKVKMESAYWMGFPLFIILGFLASLSFPPLYFIFVAGSFVFYFVQPVKNKVLSAILAVSGPLLLAILLLVI
ncbi:hypothetical protein CM49_06013 [Paenibacillus sp. P1XP2]|nr:hypothetical protein CM49_06013 [Paenibacillus sp. P1XP2]